MDLGYLDWDFLKEYHGMSTWDLNSFGISCSFLGFFWFFFNRLSGKVLGTNIGYFQSTAPLVPHRGLLTAATLCSPAGQGAACGFAVFHPGKPTSLSSGKYLNSIISRQMYLQEKIHIAKDVFFFPNQNKR